MYYSIDLDRYRHYRNGLLEQYRDLNIDPHIAYQSPETMLYFALWGQYSLVLDDYAAFLAARDSCEENRNPAQVAHLAHTTLFWFAACWEWIGFYLNRLFSLDLNDEETYPKTVFELISKDPNVRDEHKKLVKNVEDLYDESKNLRKWRRVHFHRYLQTHFMPIELKDGDTSFPAEVIRNPNNTYSDVKYLSSLLEDFHRKLCKALKICRDLFVKLS